MSVNTILQTIENEIANLTQARNVLAGLHFASPSFLLSPEEPQGPVKSTSYLYCEPVGPIPGKFNRRTP